MADSAIMRHKMTAIFSIFVGVPCDKHAPINYIIINYLKNLEFIVCIDTIHTLRSSYYGII